MGEETSLWKALLVEHRLPWRIKIVGVMNYFLLRYVNYLKLRLSLKLSKKEDVTVVIGIKNRLDHKIKNSLESLRRQDYNQDLIKIILIDYDSKKSVVSKLKKLCKKYDIDYLRVENKPVWNRAHCLNIGIKKAISKYILTSDVDVVFEKNYISESVRELKRNPYQVILCNPIYLKKRYNDISYSKLKKLRNIGTTGQGINLTLKYYYNKIHGYDEWFKVWGSEDNDLIKRLWCLGLEKKYINDRTSFLHQWHEGFFGIKHIKDSTQIIQKNEDYFIKNHSIVRNKEGWGETV